MKRLDEIKKRLAESTPGPWPGAGAGAGAGPGAGSGAGAGVCVGNEHRNEDVYILLKG